MEWIQKSYLRVCLLQLYAYEYKCVTDLGPTSLTVLLAPFAVHVHCHMIAYVTVINNVWCIQKDLRHQLLYYCWRPPRRSDNIRNMFFFITCDIEYSFSFTRVYLLFGVIYAMTCMYIYGNKAFWNWNWRGIPCLLSGHWLSGESLEGDKVLSRLAVSSAYLSSVFSVIAVSFVSHRDQKL